MDANEIRLVLCTFPGLLEARQIGAELVRLQLAACVNLCAQVESIYRWQGKLETSSEVLAIFKTTAGGLPTLERELAARHPYDTPEIVALRPEAVAERYAAWVRTEVTEPLASPSAD